jgi:putative addiction module component (TIGR02574 family)
MLLIQSTDAPFARIFAGASMSDKSPQTQQPTPLPLTDVQRTELDRRLAADDESPEEGLTWEEVKKRITDQL